MRNVFLGILFVSFAAATSAYAAENCSLTEFDKKAPQHVSDKAPVSPTINFEWASDSDPYYTNQWKAWHYIKNLNDRSLSLNWEKPGLLIPFGRPLPRNGVFCSFNYTDENGFYIDNDAPIKPSTGETVAAQAYVPKVQKVSVRGTEIRTQYEDDGKIRDAFAFIHISYSAETAQIQVATGEGISIGLNPQDLGVGIESFRSQAKEQKILVGEEFELKEVVAAGPDLAQTFVARSRGPFSSISSPGGAKMVVARTQRIATETPILVLKTNRELIAATKMTLSVGQ